MPQPTSVSAVGHAIPHSHATTISPPCGFRVATASPLMLADGYSNPATGTTICSSSIWTHNAGVLQCRDNIGKEETRLAPMSIVAAMQPLQAGNLGYAPPSLQSQVRQYGSSSSPSLQAIHAVHAVSLDPDVQTSANSGLTAVSLRVPHSQSGTPPSRAFPSASSGVHPGPSDVHQALAKNVLSAALGQNTILNSLPSVNPLNPESCGGAGLTEKSETLSVVTETPVMCPSPEVLDASHASCQSASDFGPPMESPYRVMLSEVTLQQQLSGKCSTALGRTEWNPNAFSSVGIGNSLESLNSHVSLVANTCGRIASLDPPSLDCNSNHSGPAKRRSSNSTAARGSRSLRRLPRSLPLNERNATGSWSDVLLQAGVLQSGTRGQQVGPNVCEPPPVSMPLASVLEQEQRQGEQGGIQDERTSLKAVNKKTRQTKQRQEHKVQFSSSQLGETVQQQKEEHLGPSVVEQRLPGVQHVEQMAFRHGFDPFQVVPSTNLQHGCGNLQQRDAQQNDDGQFSVTSQDLEQEVLLHTHEPRGHLLLHCAQQFLTQIKHLYRDTVKACPLQYEPPQQQLLLNTFSQPHPVCAPTKEPVAASQHQVVVVERPQSPQPAEAHNSCESAVSRATEENIPRDSQEQHREEQPSCQSPTFPSPSSQSAGVLAVSGALPNNENCTLVHSHGHPHLQQEMPWHPHHSLSSVDPFPRHLLAQHSVVKQTPRRGHQRPLAAVAMKSDSTTNMQSGASGAHKRLKGQQLSDCIPVTDRNAFEAQSCTHGDLPQTSADTCAPSILDCKDPASSTSHAGENSGNLFCRGVSPLTAEVQTGAITFHGISRGKTQSPADAVASSQADMASVRKESATSIVKRGPQRITGKRKNAAKANPRDASSPGSCRRSPSVTRVVTCVVLGFGASMPGQRTISEASLVGLVNLGGGSCFLNVVLQCLANLQPLRDFYLHHEDMLPSREILGRQYDMYTQYLEASHHHVRRLKRGPHQLINTPAFTTSITWELAVVINHMWRSPGSVKLLKPEALYQACCRIMPEFDPREMQDSDEFLRLLLDFLDAELRAAACQIPLHKALMLQMRPKKLAGWPTVKENDTALSCAASASAEAVSCNARSPEITGGAHDWLHAAAAATGTTDQEKFADLPTLFSVFFEGAELDKVCCLRCGRCTATLVPFKSLAVAMTQQAQKESCQYASLRIKPSAFSHLLTKVDLVECLNHHFAEDCDSLRLSSGEGYFCENCGSKQDAMKSCSLVRENLPFILCLTLKRFVRGKQTYKIWNPVHFDEYIDLSRYVEGFKAPVPVSTDESTKSTSALPESSGEEPIVWASPSPVTAPSPTRETLGGERVSSVDVPSVSRPAFSSFTYRLVALVEHEGPAMDQGHYVCYVKHMNLNEWFRANDKVIEPADLEGSVLSACPYMLFYQRVLLDATATPVSLGEAPNICLAKDVAHTNHGFSGLFEQAKIAKGIGKGKWSTWQHLISGLGEPFPGFDGAGGSVQDNQPLSSETSRCSSQRKALFKNSGQFPSQ